jgi:hypothetical protein
MSEFHESERKVRTIKFWICIKSRVETEDWKEEWYIIIHNATRYDYVEINRNYSAKETCDLVGWCLAVTYFDLQFPSHVTFDLTHPSPSYPTLTGLFSYVEQLYLNDKRNHVKLVHIKCLIIQLAFHYRLSWRIVEIIIITADCWSETELQSSRNKVRPLQGLVYPSEALNCRSLEYYKLP